MLWPGRYAYGHAGALLASAHLVHYGATGGGQPPPPTLPSVQHAGAVVVPKLIAQSHRAVQEGRGVEVKAFGGKGGKGIDLKVVQRLWANPQYDPVLQVSG